MSTLILVVVCALPVAIAFYIARRKLAHWSVVIVLMLCGAFLIVTTSLDHHGDKWKQRLNQWVTTEHTAAREVRR